MKNLITLLALSAMSVSCVNLSGRLNVNELMNVKKKGGFLNLKTKTVQLAPGSYQASLKVNSSKSFTLKLKSEKEGESDILIPLKSKKDFSLPSNGNVIIRGSEISQPFDVSGVLETTITESGMTRTTEACTVQRTENHCEKTCYAPTPSTVPNCNIICRDVLVTFEGSRFVEYHYRYTHRNLSAELLDSENKAVKATFSGTDTESDRINDYMGECR